MKWNNKGHEFDQIYQNIESKKAFYLFGAGDYGRQFYKAFHDEVEIKAFLDNSADKQGNNIIFAERQVPCISLKEAVVNEEVGIIVTMSQIARTDAVAQLLEEGYRKDIDFFIIEEFISVYNVYKYNKVYFSSISFLPSTACNLKCRHCLNFNPFAEKYYVRQWDSLVADVDLFFRHVDHIMLFHVSGGEPMLYSRIADLIEYINKNYGDRIDTLRTVTNGTVVPSDEICEKLSKYRIEITVDDYRDAVPQYNENFDQLIQKLEKYKIRYYINKVDSWVDLAPEKTDYSGWSREELIRHCSECNQSWQELRDGKLYSCNYAAYAVVAGIGGEQDLEETYDLRTHTKDRNKELIEFRLGFTDKGYTNFCKTCKGFKRGGDISKCCFTVRGENMRKDIRRLAIFVIWDKDGTVDEYVKYYIESLLKAVSRLIIVSNAALDDENYRKLTEYSEEVYVRENKGFDAGAYQYVIQDILNDDIALYDEIVLSNDTCYGPFIPFDVIFESMEGKDVDFWGLNYIDNNFLSHLQSYFLVFRRRALPKVVEFFDYKINRNTIRLVNLYSDFEFGIYKFLLDAGFRPGHLVPFNNFNIYKSPNYCIRDFHLPFMKKKCFSSKYYERDNCVAALKYIESHSDYSIEYILQNAKRLYNL